MTQQSYSPIRTLSINDALATTSGIGLGKEFTVLDDITLDDLVDAPAQVGFLLIALCTEGQVDFTMNGRQCHMKPGDLLISFGEQIFRDGSSDGNFHAKAVLMSRTFAQNCLVGMDKMWPYLLFLMEHPVLTMTESEQLWLLECYQLIRKRLNRPTPGRYMREATVSLVRAFYFEICNLLDVRVPQSSSQTQSRAYAIFDQFIKLVSQHFKHERSVEWYSSEMCLTPKHLSEVVKLVSGKTAGQWINTLVIIEIKSLLMNTPLSIKEIAMEMNFPNQSFLGKYFKNTEGISPSDFRKGMPG